MSNRTSYVMIRYLDADLWRRMRIEAVRRHVIIAEVVNEALEEWLERQLDGKLAGR